MQKKTIIFKIGVLALAFCFWQTVSAHNAAALNLDKLKAYFLAGDYKLAIAEGEKILAATEQARDPRLDELYYLLGLSYLKDGNYLRACDIFEIILKEFKSSVFQEEAEIGLGDIYFLKGDYDKAQGYYKGLIDNNPDSKLRAGLYYRLGQVEYKKGNIQQANEYMRKLKEEFPLNAEAGLNKEFSLAPDIYYTVQVGSFSNLANARNLCNKLSRKGYYAYSEDSQSNGKTIYRVKVGKLKSRSEAAALENKLSSEGYPTKIIP